ncbi:PadR family transcriptional regulator [Kutzneria chonburiensis]|uniref:PadR family transcriptional regulator n=1 Tax=Kutzneria chonburiensis TaxID=1483604 RepID=A0ABV6N774_9PSEU|nr:PadR family transcriptional regulator [Kutzneria chonburiensis]
MVELVILGLLAAGPAHGYELRLRIPEITGHGRPVADGTLYPAIKRLTAAGLLSRQARPGRVAAPRQVLTLTSAGQVELTRRLALVDVADDPTWLTALAFLTVLPDPAELLRRRLEVLEARALPAATDPYQQCRLEVLAAGRAAELAWLRARVA